MPLERGYDGLNMGLYREKNKLYNIQWRNTDEERKSLLSHLDTLPIRGENICHLGPSFASQQ